MMIDFEEFIRRGKLMQAAVAWELIGAAIVKARGFHRNRARCRQCGDVIESKYRHDWKSCSCGAIFVDGGKDYQHRGGNLDLIEEMP